MDKICVYTCITGNYDDLQEIENKEKNIDYYCFTNNKKIKSNTWKIVYIEQDGLDNQRLSRKIKMLGHPIINDAYDISVWMDANVVFNKSIVKFVNTYLKKNSFASFRHGFRNCIYEEAIECIKNRKDSKENILKTINFLKKENYPKDNGLYEMTVFIKRHNDEKVKETMKLWFDMVCNYSKRDQLSFMYCVWKTGLKIDDINLSVWTNEWFSTNNHNYKKVLENYRIYYGDDQTDFDYNLDEQKEYKIKDNVYQIDTVIPTDTDSIMVELTNVPCVKYEDLKVVNKSLNSIYFFNTIEFNSASIFYNDNGIIQLIGNFKKNQKLKISVKMIKLNDIELIDFIEYLATDNILQRDNVEKINYELDSLKTEINQILSSKSWKITKPIRYLSNLSKRK